MSEKISFFICLFLLYYGLVVGQDLQRVTDSGNITTNSIIIRNAQGLNIGVDSAVGYTATSHLLKPSPVDYRTVRFDCKSVILDGGWEFYNSSLGRSLMYVKQSGNIGIGTTNPKSALQIGDYVGNNQRKITFPGVYNFEWLALGQEGNGNSAIEFVNHTNLSNSIGVKMGTNTDNFGSGFYITTASESSAYNSLQYKATPALFINTANNVGIGTRSPQSLLAVAGTITAQRVKVTMTGWSDYVFDPGYKLPSLASVEKYIAGNKHLPDIPAEAEVVRDGLDVGDMQQMQMKKIEELTLYLIEQHKQLEQQQQVIARQQQLLSKLTDRIKELEKRSPK